MVALRDELRCWSPIVIAIDLGCVSCSSYPNYDPISDVYMFRIFYDTRAGFSVLILVSIPSFAAYSLAIHSLNPPPQDHVRFEICFCTFHVIGRKILRQRLSMNWGAIHIGAEAPFFHRNGYNIDCFARGRKV